MELRQQPEAYPGLLDNFTARGLTRWWRQATVSRKLDILANKAHRLTFLSNGTIVNPDQRVDYGSRVTTIETPLSGYYRREELIIAHEEQPWTGRRKGFVATLNYYAPGDPEGEPTVSHHFDSQAADSTTNTASFDEINGILKDVVEAVNRDQRA